MRVGLLTGEVPLKQHLPDVFWPKRSRQSLAMLHCVCRLNRPSLANTGASRSATDSKLLPPVHQIKKIHRGASAALMWLLKVLGH